MEGVFGRPPGMLRMSYCNAWTSVHFNFKSTVQSWEEFPDLAHKDFLHCFISRYSRLQEKVVFSEHQLQNHEGQKSAVAIR